MLIGCRLHAYMRATHSQEIACVRLKIKKVCAYKATKNAFHASLYLMKLNHALRKDVKLLTNTCIHSTFPWTCDTHMDIMTNWKFDLSLLVNATLENNIYNHFLRVCFS